MTNATRLARNSQSILQKILKHKQQEIAQHRRQRSLKELKAAIRDVPPPRQFRQLFVSGFHVIAEFKKASPSRGIIAEQVSLVTQLQAYERGKATAISVLTDAHFFKGCHQDLMQAKHITTLPILRKDFIIEPYQVWESRAIGADAILLIAAALTPTQVKQLSDLAGELGMAVLLELHHPTEIHHIPDNTSHLLIGINNRNLETFQVSLETSLQIKPALPKSIPAISESGVDSPQAAQRLKAAGFQGILVGEALMRSPQPEQFIQQLFSGEQQ